MSEDSGAKLASIPMAGNPGGDGIVWLGCQQGTANYFDLWSLPKPDLWGFGAGGSGGRTRGPYMHWRASRGRPYRIAYLADEETEEIGFARFRLSSRHTRSTLVVLVNHLQNIEANWLYLTNEEGTRLRESIFTRPAD